MSLGQLSLEWLLIFIALALMAGFIIGQAMDAVMGRMGFGAVGNMVVLAAGFYLGIIAFTRLRVLSGGVEMQFATGLAAAFVCLFLLAALKRMMSRS
jgi:hypothetical protein